MILMIRKKDIDHAIIVDGKHRIVHKGTPYKPVKRFFNSSEAIQYAKENKYSLIVSITDKDSNRWLIMEKVMSKSST